MTLRPNSKNRQTVRIALAWNVAKLYEYVRCTGLYIRLGLHCLVSILLCWIHVQEQCRRSSPSARPTGSQPYWWYSTAVGPALMFVLIFIVLLLSHFLKAVPMPIATAWRTVPVEHRETVVLNGDHGAVGSRSKTADVAHNQTDGYPNG
jgi:hypothetical protein